MKIGSITIRQELDEIKGEVGVTVEVEGRGMDLPTVLGLLELAKHTHIAEMADTGEKPLPDQQDAEAGFMEPRP